MFTFGRSTLVSPKRVMVKRARSFVRSYICASLRAIERAGLLVSMMNTDAVSGATVSDVHVRQIHVGIAETSDGEAGQIVRALVHLRILASNRKGGLVGINDEYRCRQRCHRK